MMSFIYLFKHDFRKRSRDGFLIGYNIIFPIVMIGLLGYLSSEGYGKEFTGYHYYTIVMLPFCIAMAVITAAYAGKDEAYNKTAIRILAAPVAYAPIILAKLFSCTIVICLCNLLVLLFAKLVFRFPISGELFPISLLLASESFAVCALGLLIGFGMKNFIFIKNVLNIPICIAAVLAGTFFPFGTLNQKLEFAIRISPLTWINRSIFLYLYDGDSRLLVKTALVTLITGIFLTILAIKLFKKEEFIHGDLLGYEK